MFSIPVGQYDAIEKAVEDRRKHFLSFITSKDLLLSLPFSSKAVYQAIPHYEFHAAVKIRKKEKQTERALMKYLSRMSLNSSPLAAFAKSQFVDWDWNIEKPAYQFEMSLSLTQRKEFFDLCYCDVGLQKYMRYRLNPSLRQHDQGFIYLHREGEEESRIALESDQQFEEMFLKLYKKDFTFEQFSMQTDYSVNDFLEAQLIVPSYPIYSEHKFVTTLVKDINQRHNMSFKPEDIVGHTRNEFTDQEVIKKQKHWESQLLRYAEKLEVGLDHKLYSERTYYLNAYSENKIKKPIIDREKLSAEVLSITALADKILINSNRIPLSWDLIDEQQTFEEPNFDISKLTIESTDDFEIWLKLDSTEYMGKYSSIGMMLRFTEADKPKLINVSTAYGKFFAPALELVDSKVKNSIKQWVKGTAKNALSLKDESLHTKNKAHGFLPELNSLGCDFQTPIQDRVSIDFLEDGSIVNADTKEVVTPTNLGIEDYNDRSIFYQNLYLHSGALPNLPILIDIIQKKYTKKMDEYVASSPRLVSNHLILGFRKWQVEKAAFDSFQDAQQIHLEQLNEWRNNYQIPRVVEYSIDKGKTFFLDFFNPWSVDSFLKLARKMEDSCTIVDLGIGEKIKGKHLFEAYFEISG